MNDHGANEVHKDNDEALPIGTTPIRFRPKQTIIARVLRVFVEEFGALDLRLTIANLLLIFLPDYRFSRLRTAIYRLAGVQIGPHSLIAGRIEFIGGGRFRKRLRIGAHTYVNAHLCIDLHAEIDIGDDVSIGHHVTLITTGHDLGPACRRAGAMRPQPITVADGCWLGAGTTILPGCSLGASSVVATGSVVNGVIPPNKMLAGVPARVVRSLPVDN